MHYALSHNCVKAFSITITYLSHFDKNDTPVSRVTALDRRREQESAPAGNEDEVKARKTV
jgi:hypothetical protein